MKKDPKAIQNRRLRKKNLILTLKVVKDIWSVIAMASDLKHWIEQSAYLITIPKYYFKYDIKCWSISPLGQYINEI